KVSWSLTSGNATLHTVKGITTLKGVHKGTVVLSATSLDGGNVVSRLTIHVIGRVLDGKTYNTVTSPTTGRIWLDRNLGADKVCGMLQTHCVLVICISLGVLLMGIRSVLMVI
ncbi:hypothetical protein BSPWISOXPB_6651, partial [uncultured Gammaproteobacteria bacterium]